MEARAPGPCLPRTASVEENGDTATNINCIKRSMTVSISLQGRRITSATLKYHDRVKKLGMGTSGGERDGCTTGEANSFTSKLMQYGGGNHHCGNFKVGAFPNSGRGAH